MKRLNQFGFEGITVMIGLAVILLLVGSGVFVYSRRHSGSLFSGGIKPAASTTDAGTSTSPNGIPGGANAGASGGSSPSGGSSDNVIRLAEAGLQITVPDSLKDLTSHTVTNNGVVTVTFSTVSLTKTIPSCAADQGRGAFDVVVKGPGTYPGPAPYSGGIIKQLPTFYIGYQLPVAPCGKNLTVKGQTLLDDQAQDFYSSIQSVQPL